MLALAGQGLLVAMTRSDSGWGACEVMRWGLEASQEKRGAVRGR